MIELGHSAFGSIFAARHSFMRVAVKVLKVSESDVPALRREVALHASLAHEHIVRVYGLSESLGDNPRYGIVMARMDRSLASVLRDAAAAPNALIVLPFHWRMRALHEMTAGLAHLHGHRVVHGNFKCVSCIMGCVYRFISMDES